MERRKAITTAAAAALTLLAGAAGIALNTGIVNAGDDGNVGQLNPVSSAHSGSSVDDRARASSLTPLVQPSQSPPVTASSASGYDDSDEHEGDDNEGHDDKADSEDDHEYEGRDDDD